jgi:hypothetical protein
MGIRLKCLNNFLNLQLDGKSCMKQCKDNTETFEKLYIHLFNCELYNCSICDFLEKSLIELKKNGKTFFCLFTIEKWIEGTMVKSPATLIAGTKF